MSNANPFPEEPEQRGDQLPPTDDGAPTGGDEATEDRLQADNEAEEVMLKAFDPEAPSG